MPTRGTYNFTVGESGDLTRVPENVALLQRLWLDGDIVDGQLGPGVTAGGNGGWHSACHLVAAGGVMRKPDNRILWLELSHASSSDSYFASVSVRSESGIQTYPVASEQGRPLVEDATLLGFVEGTSEGHISARGVNDPAERFEGWRRQDYDQSPGTTPPGGRVWEHWCTTRDISDAQPIGKSVVEGYIILASAIGGKFAPVVARGRRDYGHPRQLGAMVESGLTSPASARPFLTPMRMPRSVELVLHEATPEAGLRAAEQLTWSAELRYFMFSRKIDRWNSAPVQL
jgi:hypothetical protein